MDEARPREQAHLGEVFWPEPEDALAARAASDPAALSDLYDRLFPAVDRYCRRRLQAEDQIEDVVSQIFLKMIEGLRRNRIEHFRPWLFTIAHNEVVNTYRRRRDHDPIEAAEHIETADRSPEESVIAMGMGQELRALLPFLSRDEQTLIELRLFGLSNPEICSTMNRSTNWVRVTQFRAYARLRSLLSDRSTEVGS